MNMMYAMYACLCGYGRVINVVYKLMSFKIFSSKSTQLLPLIT